MFILEERKLSGILAGVYKYMKGRIKKRELGFSQSCPVTGQETKGTNGRM